MVHLDNTGSPQRSECERGTGKLPEFVKFVTRWDLVGWVKMKLDQSLATNIA